VAAGLGLAILVIVRHRTNVARLLEGTENRIRLGGSGKGAR
jgi:glycerol-3-phosphate acyltransferase PlsY